MIKMVMVTWLDAQRVELSLWSKEEAKDIEPLVGDIIGFLIYENKDKIIISQQKWDESEQLKYITIIPKRSIIKITELKERKMIKKSKGGKEK